MNVNPEAWAKAVDVLLSWRRTSKLLLGAVLFVGIVAFGGIRALSAAADGQVPEAVTVAVLLVFAFAAGALAVDGLLAVGAAIAGRVSSARVRNEVERDRLRGEQRHAERVREVLPVMPGACYETLAACLDGPPVPMPLGSTTTFFLEGHSLVERGTVLDRNTALYRLHPVARPIVEQFFRDVRRRALEQHLSRLRDSEKEFLRLFLEPAPAEPPKPDDPLMPSDVYQGAQTLVRHGVLSRAAPVDGRPSVETVFIPDDAVDLVESRVLGGPVQRRSVELDPRRIASSVGRGSGA